MEPSGDDVVQGAVAGALTGQVRYDDLADAEQALVRAAWEGAIADAIHGLDYEPGLVAAGESWAEADAQGRVVLRGADGDRAPDATAWGAGEALGD